MNILLYHLPSIAGEPFCTSRQYASVSLSDCSYFRWCETKSKVHALSRCGSVDQTLHIMKTAEGARMGLGECNPKHNYGSSLHLMAKTRARCALCDTVVLGERPPHRLNSAIDRVLAKIRCHACMHDAHSAELDCCDCAMLPKAAGRDSHLSLKCCIDCKERFAGQT
jgi:hypothetical protein